MVVTVTAADFMRAYTAVNNSDLGLPANKVQCWQNIGIANHSQMSKPRMHKQTQKHIGTGFTNAETRQMKILFYPLCK